MLERAREFGRWLLRPPVPAFPLFTATPGPPRREADLLAKEAAPLAKEEDLLAKAWRWGSYLLCLKD